MAESASQILTLLKVQSDLLAEIVKELRRLRFGISILTGEDLSEVTSQDLKD